MDSRDAIKRANTTGGVILPAIVALIVGVYRLATMGAHWSAIVITAGAVLSLLTTSAYSASKGREGRSWGLAAASGAILLPWAFSLYLMGYEGVYRAFLGLTSEGVASIGIGLLWILAGWRMLYMLGKMQRA